MYWKPVVSLCNLRFLSFVTGCTTRRIIQRYCHQKCFWSVAIVTILLAPRTNGNLVDSTPHDYCALFCQVQFAQNKDQVILWYFKKWNCSRCHSWINVSGIAIIYCTFLMSSNLFRVSINASFQTFRHINRKQSQYLCRPFSQLFSNYLILL